MEQASPPQSKTPDALGYIQSLDQLRFAASART